MDGRAFQQQRQLFRQQRTVGGETDAEAKLLTTVQNFRQLWVQERLSHDVEVQKIGVRPELSRQQGKGLRRHKALFPRRARTESAGQIAHVGDLHIGAAEHGAFPPLRRFCLSLWDSVPQIAPFEKRKS